jgi:acyl-CoA reductase-like NAD-dependent aldehyde dehydrogenase
MDNFTWTQVLWSLLIAGGGLTSLLKLASIISAKISLRREAKEQKAKELVQNSIDLEKTRIEAEHINEEAVRKAIWDLLKEKKEEIDRLETKVQQLEQGHSLSQATVMKVYGAARQIRSTAEEVKRIARGLPDNGTLLQTTDDLIKCCDHLESVLP